MKTYIAPWRNPRCLEASKKEVPMKKKLSKEQKREERKQKLRQINMIWNKIGQQGKSHKVKNTAPRSYKARKAGVYVFWIGFAAMGLHLATDNGPTTEAVEQKAPVVQLKENPATSQASVQFAKDFSEKYFFWKQGDEGREMRQKDMSYFLADGLDEFAGLNMDELKTDSTFKEAKVKDVKEISKKKAKITLAVKYEITVPAKDDKAKPEKKLVEKGFIVPVEYNGRTYGVYELPTFTKLPDKTTVKIEDRGVQKKINDINTVQNISNFLNTFFSSYSQDTPDKLSYILTDKQAKNGLQQSFKFIEVETTEVYEGEKKGQYLVECGVIMQDPDSQSQFSTNYTLTVEKKDDHYIVSKIN